MVYYHGFRLFMAAHLILRNLYATWNGKTISIILTNWRTDYDRILGVNYGGCSVRANWMV